MEIDLAALQALLGLKSKIVGSGLKILNLQDITYGCIGECVQMQREVEIEEAHDKADNTHNQLSASATGEGKGFILKPV